MGKISIISLLVLISSPVLAAKPVKIIPVGSDEANGNRNYLVECSNGKKLPISSWEAGKRWCQGEAQDNCVKKQIRAAKNACK